MEGKKCAEIVCPRGNIGKGWTIKTKVFSFSLKKDVPPDKSRMDKKANNKEDIYTLAPGGHCITSTVTKGNAKIIIVDTVHVDGDGNIIAKTHKGKYPSQFFAVKR